MAETRTTTATTATVCTEAEERAAIMEADGIETPAPAAGTPAPADQDPLANADAECNAPIGRDIIKDFPENVTPEDENPDALLRGLFLLKGVCAFLVSTTGIGKSVLVTQAALLWAAGLSFFGIAPVRPIRIAVFQSENNDEEITRFRNGIVHGVFPGKSLADVAALLGGRLRFYNLKGLMVSGLCSAIKALMRSPEKPDLIIVDPLVALCLDWNDQAAVSELFYGRLDKMADQYRFGLWIVAHMGKIDPKLGMKVWRDSDVSEYAVMGSSILADYARATLVLLKTDAPGYFILRAAKRGASLDWTDATGEHTNDKIIAWSKEPGVLYWREPEPGEYAAALAKAQAAKSGDAGAATTAKPAEVDIHLKPWRSMSESDREKAKYDVAQAVWKETDPLKGAATGKRLREIACSLFGKAGRALADCLAAEAAEPVKPGDDKGRWLYVARAKYNNTSIFSTSEEAARAAAEAYMARVRAGKVAGDDVAEGGAE